MIRQLLTTALCLCIGLVSAQDRDEFKQLFNGKNLTGWDANPKLWSVKDGVIIGKTETSEDLKNNEFLIWKGGQLKNFELHAVVKVIGENNSGIQYRSKELPDVGKWVVGGYQCDIHPSAEYTAMMYHERGRGIVARNGQNVITDPEGKKWLVGDKEPVAVDIAKFHTYSIIANGNRIVHQIDGQNTIEFEDHDAAQRSLSGLLAFQIHKGKPMEVHIKSVKLKTLPDGGVVPFEKADIPNDAQIIEKKKPAGKGKAKAKSKGKAMPAKKPAAPSNAKAKAKPKPKRPTEVGPEIGENVATPTDRIKVPEGFQVELVYSVPGKEQGSWVAMTPDPQGRVYASDQYGVLYRFTPPAAGKVLKKEDVEKVPVEIRAINGMTWYRDALFVGVNDYEKQIDSGLYKLTDSDGDDQLDKVELLRSMEARGDHGVHAVVPAPDGESLFLITGNNADLTEVEKSSPVAPLWGDDHLLERMPDGRGHNRHRLAPGGIIYQISPDGKKFKAYANGYRNIYDGAFNKDGELFTYDADMEYDFNTPWYRPTRVNHVTSGAEAGWRHGAGKYPEFYPDNLPASVNIGPGSPTGACFGYGAKWPAKYQNAFYVFDWSWGKVYAVHLEEDGSSYTGTKEEFITGAPLPVTDAFIHPADGAMYFAIGGRRVQSGLYRVTYTGKESTELVSNEPVVTEARALRHELEAFHGVQDHKAVETAWPHLNHDDRFIRWAARVALEHQPASEWAEKAIAEKDAGRQLSALLALVRLKGKCPDHAGEDHIADTKTRDRVLSQLLQMKWVALSTSEKFEHVRLAQITMHRFGRPSGDSVKSLIAYYDPHFPSESFELNWLLCDTMVYLEAPSAAAKGMALISASASQEPQLQFARSLRHLETGWTPELREQQLNWFLTAANYRGGASFSKFVEMIRTDSLATFSEGEKAAHAELIAKKPEVKSAIENLGVLFAGRTPTMWTLDELSAATKGDGMKNRDFENGRKMFTAAACYACHRFGNAGGMNGPDLTGAGGRYSPHDLLESIIHPSKEINEQFAPIVVTKTDDSVVSGVVVNLNGNYVTLNTDLSDPNQRVNVDRTLVKSIEVSKVSPMPENLLMMLSKEEILDLLAYTLSGGDSSREMFQQK